MGINKDNLGRRGRRRSLGTGPRVGCDIDGVLRDLDGRIDSHIQKNYPDARINNKQKHHWDYQEKFYNVPNIDHILFEEKGFEIFSTADAFPGASVFLQNLKIEVEKQGGNLCLVTHQKPETARGTLSWLSQLPVFIEEILILPLEPRKSKTVAECDILIDDFIKNLQEQEDAGGTSICFDQPWNKEWNGLRTNTYEETLALVRNELKKNKQKTKGKGIKCQRTTQ